MESTVVLPIASSEIVALGLVTALQHDARLEVLNPARSAEEALARMAEKRCDVLVVCDSLPLIGPLELISALSAQFPSVAVLLLLTWVDNSALRAAFAAGVRGVLEATTSATALRSAVRSVASGGSVLAPSLTKEVLKWASQVCRPEFSARELQVMHLVSAGTTDREIASSLGISVNTVKTYVRRSLNKLACDCRAEGAMRLARLEYPRPPQTLAG